MTILISQQLSLFNFEHLDILCPQIEHPCEKLWPFKFLESFRCSISNALINYVPKSDIREKCYDHSNFSRPSVIQFGAPRYIMHLNQTFEWDHLNFSRASIVQLRAFRYIMFPNRNSVRKVMTIWISRELLLFNFERLDKLCPRIGHPNQKLCHFNFSRSSVVQFWASQYIMSQNQTSVWKVMTIQISWEFPLFNCDHLDILCPRIRHPCENSWPFEFLKSFCCSISCVSINYVPDSDIRVKSYDHLNFSRGSVVQFGASRYIMSQNQTS